MMRDEALVIEHLSKTFPGTTALDDVSFSVRAGHVHALVGGNGSGKSTLLKIMAGIHRGERGGRMVVADQRLPADQVDAARARAAGLRFVHQELGLFPELSVEENMAIGSGFPTRRGTIDRRQLRERADKQLARRGIAARADTLVGNLPLSTRTLLAVARAFADDDSPGPLVFVLDEPTAALAEPDARRVHVALRDAADAGHAALFVSHRLEEVRTVADRVTVLRDGRVVGTLPREELGDARLIEMMTGSAPRPTRRPPTHLGPAVALEARGLAGTAVRGIDLTVHRGEILGLTGPLGSGRSELLRMLFCALPADAGTIALDGAPVSFEGVHEAMRAGVAYVPQDRAAAVFPQLSVSANLAAASTGSTRAAFPIRHRAEEAAARADLAKFRIRAASPQQMMQTLSGGNQQKVILARSLRRAPKLLLLDEPTHGVDVASRAELHDIVAAAAAAGTAVIVASDDFDELSTLADRVAVMVDGVITAELRQPDVHPARLAELAFGPEAGV